NSLAATQALKEGDSVDETYTVRVTDDFGAYVDQTVTVTIKGTNDIPVVNADIASVTEDTVQIVNGNILTNDTDVDSGAVLTVSQVNGDSANVGNPVAGTYGSVTINTNGTYSYTLNNSLPAVQALAVGETFTDTFATTTTDEHGATRSTTLTITINGTNDTPVISVGSGDSALEVLPETNAGLSTSGTLTLSDLDITNTVSTNIISVSVGGQTTGLIPNNAQLLGMLSATGNLTNTETTGPINWTFDSNSEAFNYLAVGQNLTLTYTVRATDSYGATDDQTITIIITGANDAPVAVADTNSVTEDTVLTATGNILTNDTDADNGEKATLTVAEVNGVSGNVGNPVAGTYGSVTIGLNGDYTYSLTNSLAAVQALA
ncbi:MAG: VCBS domain-containing protein, partial [Synergistaceae bacterium]